MEVIISGREEDEIGEEAGEEDEERSKKSKWGDGGHYDLRGKGVEWLG